ncbi:MAG: gamma-glutamyltransferase family protein [Defluviitaleaceae bacterium]|nr:gamma-glutamyltransferase family protein [Defluviitaleaceae bacterium]
MNNPLLYPYPSSRTAHYARKGMVATSQPLAAQAGLQILQKGGNAIDAAIATAACLTVVEPTSNGIGGDAFAIVWAKGELHGLNASGRSPKNISIEKVKALGHEAMPKLGFTPVTVPGAPAAWAELSKRFGKLSLAECLAPAIEYARNGYPISPTAGKFWERGMASYKKAFGDREVFKPFFETFAPNGNAPKIGELWQSEGHASTLEEIAETNAESFYKGRLAQAISDFSAKHDGFITAEDLSEYAPEYVKPISANYRGYDVWEIPPNGQGLVALIGLNILKGYEFTTRDCVETYHKQFEAIKLAFAVGKETITDPEFMNIKTETLLSDSFAEFLRKKITPVAALPQAYLPPKSGTVYLAAADDEGNMISFIQSNYMGFGSGIVIPNTGISLQNRGADFSLDPNHANALAGGKRTYHTIIPGFLTKAGIPIGPFGIMGGYMQPQAHVQVLMNIIDFGLNPQAALDAPRWQWLNDKKFEVERGFPAYIVESLTHKGHSITMPIESGSFGRGQIIFRNPENGVLVGGTEHRTDGTIASW